MAKKQRVLITLPKINRLGGATVLSNELAEYLMNSHYDVFIYTTLCEPPASEFFIKKNMNIITSTDVFPYHLKDFDYIFVNSQIFPKTLVEDFGGKQTKYPKIFFFHKSPLDWIPDEFPWIYGFEEKISDASLFVSEKILEAQKPFFRKKTFPLEFYNNPTPTLPKKLENFQPNQTLQKVLIVSNHTPQEIKDAALLLKKQGIVVDGLGDGNKSGLINYELLSQYDLTITIGKTVQYCLVLGQPVYVYDHFGGGGYLNEKEFPKSKLFNFSGRESEHKKTAKEIHDEILSGYKIARAFSLKNREQFRKEFLIDYVLPGIMVKTKKLPKPILPKEYIKSIQAAQTLASNYFTVAAERDNLQDSVKELNDNLKSLKSSTSWRIGQKIVRPANSVKRLFNR